jgi:hyaluronoglucosaminidase
MWKASDYLHLNPASYHIEVEASEDGEFIVKGRASDADLALMAKICSYHCYQVSKGADCREMKEAAGCSGV